MHAYNTTFGQKDFHQAQAQFEVYGERFHKTQSTKQRKEQKSQPNKA